MDTKTEIALTDFARALSKLVGTGKPLSLIEVADETGCDDHTIRNYRGGRTVPSLEWTLRFSALYGRRFQADVLNILNAAMGPVGFFVAPMDGIEPSILDANGDGRTCGKDARILADEAARDLADYSEASERSSSDRIRSGEQSEPMQDNLRGAAFKIHAARQIEATLVGKRQRTG